MTFDPGAGEGPDPEGQVQVPLLRQHEPRAQHQHPSPDEPESGSVSISPEAMGEQAICVQEWTGTAWVIVEEIGRREGFFAKALDAARVRGKYLGERVVTPLVRV